MKSSPLLLFGLLIASGCSDSPGGSSPAALTAKDNQLTWATVSDADGIKAIRGLQHIPAGGGFNEYDVDFKFTAVGSKTADIYIGSMFDTPGTAVHVDVTDMRGDTTHLFIRSTGQGHQIGTYRPK